MRDCTDAAVACPLALTELKRGRPGAEVRLGERGSGPPVAAPGRGCSLRFPATGAPGREPYGATLMDLTAIYERDGQWVMGYIVEIPGVDTQGRALDECRGNLRAAGLLVAVPSSMGLALARARAPRPADPSVGRSAFWYNAASGGTRYGDWEYRIARPAAKRLRTVSLAEEASLCRQEGRCPTSWRPTPVRLASACRRRPAQLI